MTSPAPLVSIIIPAYRSHETIGRSLETMCAQTYHPIELLVVDSSPDDRTVEAVRSKLPGQPVLRSERRLLPHAARNLGASHARGDLLLFTDPDIYAPGTWVETLVKAQASARGAAVGSVACYGRGWLDMGLHLVKFDKWLPGGGLRRIDIGPTANLLCLRADFEAVGGFEGEAMLGDTLLSWKLTQAGIPLWFVPGAVVEHDHRSTGRQFLRERFERGAEFGSLRIREKNWSKSRVALHLLVTILPLRLAKLVLRVASHAWQAGMLGEWLRVLPVVVAGESAWLAGEALSYARRLWPVRG